MQPPTVQAGVAVLLDGGAAGRIRAWPRQSAIGGEGRHLRLRRLRPREQPKVGHPGRQGPPDLIHVGLGLDRRRHLAERADLRRGLGTNQGRRPLPGARLGRQVRSGHCAGPQPLEGEAHARAPAGEPLPAPLQVRPGGRPMGHELRQDGFMGQGLGRRLADDVWSCRDHLPRSDHEVLRERGQLQNVLPVAGHGRGRLHGHVLAQTRGR
mmetsp:Transcript_38962/g.77579  ORF Transcript_38962/g.77579 Transcript_38962/m.77579 type:complete len:210 (-) Transcript_38962:328-957(-)